MIKPICDRVAGIFSTMVLFETTAKSVQPSDSTSPKDVKDQPRKSCSLPFIDHHSLESMPALVPNLIETCPELLTELPGSLDARSSNPSQLKSPAASPVPRFELLNKPTSISSTLEFIPADEP